MCVYICILGVLRSGFLRAITESSICRPIRSLIRYIFLKLSFYNLLFLSCRIIHSDTPNSIFRHVFSVWISFVKMEGIPLLADSCERGFLYLFEGWRGIFQKYTFISPKCLIIQCTFIFTIVQPLLWFQLQTLLLKMLFHCDSFTVIQSL